MTVSLREPVAVFFIVVMILIQVFIFGERLGPLFVSIALFYRGVNALFGCQASWIAMLSNIGSFEIIHKELEEQRAQEAATTDNIQIPSSTDISFANVCSDKELEFSYLKEFNSRIHRAIWCRKD